MTVLRLATLVVAGSATAALPLLAQSRVVIEASRILDGRGQVLDPTRIVIENGKISSLDPNAQGRTYDLRGYTVLPGWIDTHVHIGSHFGKDGRIATDQESPEEASLGAAANAWLTLMAGFTTVQSVGAPADLALREAIKNGLPGPRILTSLDPIMGKGDSTGTPDQLRAMVRDRASRGPT